MTQRDQIDAFEDDILAVVNRYVHGFNLSTAAAVGTLEVIKWSLIDAVMNKEE
jgi:hypothetical protein